jgi:hypothetical protein
VKSFDGIGLSVEGERTEELVGRAKKLAYLTRSQALARGLLAFRKYENLPDGGYMYSVKIGDVVRVHAVPGNRPDPQPAFDVEQVPDFGSGWITDGRIEITKDERGRDTSRVLEFTPTPGTVERLSPRPPAPRMPSGRQKSARYAVLPAADRPDLNPPRPVAVWSQYLRLRPSMYSGLMVKVAQALMGFGKTGKPSAFRRYLLQDKLVPPPGAVPSAEESEASSAGVKLRYDNRFYRTHGIAKDADGKLWLCEIGSRGVLIMRLPYWTHTDKAAFKARLELKDPEAWQMIDELGGFPSGTTPPTDPATLAAAKRAGVVIELCTEAQAAQFYKLQTFSSQIGWAFNEAGTEAHNVGYEYDSNGVPFTEHWHAQFSIGSAIVPTALQTQAAALLNSLVRSATRGGTYQAIVRSKSRYLSLAQLNSLIGQARSDPAAAFEALDQLQATRIPATATWALARRATFYHPNPVRPPALKIYEPLAEGLVSVTMTRLGGQGFANVPELMDATMYVYFIGNQLKTVKYYWDRVTTLTNTVEDDYEECMLAGNWSRFERRGFTGVPPTFYTADVDPREPYADTEIETTVTGTAEGTTGAVPTDDFSLPSRSFIVRSWTFMMKTDELTRDGAARRGAVCVPQFAREGVLVAFDDVTSSELRSITYVRQGIADPWQYTAWRTVGGFVMPAYMVESCGESRTLRRVDEAIYTPTLCSDFVDQGSWLSRCDGVGDEINGGLPEVPANVAVSALHKGVLAVYADFPPLGAATRIYLDRSEGNPQMPWDTAWFARSPSPLSGSFQQAQATWNCLGDGTTLVTAAGPDYFGGTIVRGVPFDARMQTNFPTFVGVVNADSSL